MIAQGTTVQVLYFDQINQPFDKIIQNHSKFANVSQIRLFDATVTKSIASALAEMLSSPSTRVRSAQIDECRFSRDAVSVLANGIASSRQLRKLALSAVPGDDLRPFAAIFAKTRSINIIDLLFDFSNYRTGFKELCDVIAKNQTVVDMFLGEGGRPPRGVDTSALILQALAANKVLRTLEVRFSSPSRQSTPISKMLNQFQYDQLNLQLGMMSTMIAKPPDYKYKMLMEAYRLFKYCRFLAGCRSSENGLKYPFEIIAQIMTKAMITEKSWIKEQLDTIIRCLLKRQTVGQVRHESLNRDDPRGRPFQFNETVLFVICKRVLAEMAD